MRRLLVIDACAAGSSGVLMLLLRGWLSPWYRIPTEVLAFMGLVSLVYCAYSSFLATRIAAPPRLVRVLVAANLAWASACVVAAIALFDVASVFGLGHLVIEALFVAALALVERRRLLSQLG
jgi:hypothetical protein